MNLSSSFSVLVRLSVALASSEKNKNITVNFSKINSTFPYNLLRKPDIFNPKKYKCINIFN